MNNQSQNQVSAYCPRFGQLAVEMGFITSDQLKQGLAEQVDDNLSNRPHRILGTIFFEHGWMTPGQVDMVLNQMFKLLREADAGNS